MLKKPTTSIPNPGKTGVPSVKIPRISGLASSTDKPSVFWKSEIEEFAHVKHPTLCKLRDFLGKKHRKT
jgi:hypothetical protein